ncbi:MAG: ABC transporter ATP-binding protein [Streptosporangiaceae bacterium]
MGSPAALAVAVTGATVRFGDFRAVDDLSLAVPRGSMAAIVGPNGAGKSTLFGVMTGEVRLTAGQVAIGGRDVTHVPAARRARLGLAKVYQRTNVFPRLTVRESVELAVLLRQAHARPRPVWRKAKDEPEQTQGILRLLELAHHADTPVGQLSLADQRVVEFGMCLAMRPELLLLDEPTAGMSRDETQQIMSVLRRLNQETGLTVILSEHDTDVVFGLAETIWVIVGGKVLRSGSPAEIENDRDVRRIYLGLTDE